MFPFVTLADIEQYRTLPQIFDSGLRTAGPEAQFLGHRPVESQNPPKFANHYVWQTWAEIDRRRRNVGSALEGLFRSGAAVGTNGLDTVGIWSANVPGRFSRTRHNIAIPGNYPVPVVAASSSDLTCLQNGR